MTKTYCNRCQREIHPEDIRAGRDSKTVPPAFVWSAIFGGTPDLDFCVCLKCARALGERIMEWWKERHNA
jgi:hypothetical protein